MEFFHLLIHFFFFFLIPLVGVFWSGCCHFFISYTFTFTWVLICYPVSSFSCNKVYCSKDNVSLLMLQQLCVLNISKCQSTLFKTIFKKNSIVTFSPNLFYTYSPLYNSLLPFLHILNHINRSIKLKIKNCSFILPDQCKTELLFPHHLCFPYLLLPPDALGLGSLM